MNNEVIFNIGDKKLYNEIILINVDIPLLFVCIDDEENRFLVLCSDEENGEYLISQLSDNVLLEMLNQEKSMRNTLLSGKKFYKVISEIDGADKVIEQTFDEFNKELYSDDGCFLIDSPEINKYKSKLKEIKDNYELNNQNYLYESNFSKPPLEKDNESLIIPKNILENLKENLNQPSQSKDCTTQFEIPISKEWYSSIHLFNLINCA